MCNYIFFHFSASYMVKIEVKVHRRSTYKNQLEAHAEPLHYFIVSKHSVQKHKLAIF